jgi:hypothetical protein
MIFFRQAAEVAGKTRRLGGVLRVRGENVAIRPCNVVFERYPAPINHGGISSRWSRAVSQAP